MGMTTPEKMTDDELYAAWLALEDDFPVAAEKLRAHIATLTAERDSLRTQRDNATGHYDALRERVQALEADLAEERNCYNKQYDRANAAERFLAAIRQREGDEDKMLAAYDEAEVDEALLGRCDGDRNWAHAVAGVRAVARYVLGEDATGAAHEHRYRADGSCGCGATVHEFSDPTTAEAFATARESLRKGYELDEHAPGEGALALLERRMGAMAGQVRTIVDAAKVGGIYMADVNALASALTDAPPVFTLEETVDAAAIALVDYDAVRDIPGASFDRCLRQRLASLRKVTP